MQTTVQLVFLLLPKLLIIFDTSIIELIEIPTIFLVLFVTTVILKRYILWLNIRKNSLILFFSGVPQGSILVAVMYQLYTADPPEILHTFTAIFVDNSYLCGQ